jgi:pilus assembly protein Flp/PilA
MRKFVSRFAKNDSGVTALEYGILAGLISATIIAAVTLIGTDLNALFGVITTDLAAIPGV